MNHNHAHEPHGHLGHFIMVGVIGESPVLAKSPFMDKGFARLDGSLAEAPNPIHAGVQDHAMPVNGGRRRQAIGDVDADPVPLDRLYGGAMDLAIIAPATTRQPRGEFMVHLFRNQVEDLYPVFESEGQG